MRRTLVLLSASLLALTACSNETPGNATPSTSSITSQAASSSATGPAPSADVPKVTNPIDVTSFLQKPCDAVTTDQVTGWLGSGATAKPDLEVYTGVDCDMHAASGQAAVNLELSYPEKFSLPLLYTHKYEYPFFQPLQPIDGHPVVAYDKSAKDARTTLGVCQVAVGVSDQRSISVEVKLSEANVGKKDPCDAARGVATTILDNLKAGK